MSKRWRVRPADFLVKIKSLPICWSVYPNSMAQANAMDELRLIVMTLPRVRVALPFRGHPPACDPPFFRRTRKRFFGNSACSIYGYSEEEIRASDRDSMPE